MISVRFAGPCLMLAIVSACGSGGPSLSGSASESSGSNSGLSSLWEKVRALGFETGKTYEMPAVGIMADAFLADIQARGMALDAPARIFLAPGEKGRPRFDVAVDAQVMPARAAIARTGIDKMRALTPLDPDHIVYAAPVTLAMQPRKGWEVEAIDDRRVDPQFDTPFFRAHRQPSTYDEDLHIRYMEMLAISAIYTNTVFALIDHELGTSRLSDPDAARKHVLTAFQAIPVDTLKAALAEAANQVVGGRFSTDLTGSGNIHFTHIPAGDFVADPRGLTWTRAGGVWFGDGRINGQTVNLRLAATSSLSQRQAQSGTQGTNAEAKVEGGANVGPAQ
jgi:hypothetical protein